MQVVTLRAIPVCWRCYCMASSALTLSAETQGAACWASKMSPLCPGARVCERKCYIFFRTQRPLAPQETCGVVVTVRTS